MKPFLALTIAGSDSGGGAGIQADLKTFQELGVFGMSVITALTAQNSLGVHAVHPAPVSIIEAQIEAVLSDMGTDAVKTGMLYDGAITEAVAWAIGRYGVPRVVVDPVLVAKGGSELFRREELDALRTKLLPAAEIVTPNLPEACALLGLPDGALRTRRDMEQAAIALLDFGSRYVLLKGGHLENEEEEAADILAGRDDGPVWLSAPRIPTGHTHGTGCTTAAALAAYMARGYPVAEAAAAAKAFVTAAIRASFPHGAGTGSLWHGAHRGEPGGRR
ncbi:phosphomethylpyrimidine kinase [Paenibacillus sp. 32O-W]|uniref:bifunctional hydroxymethylpyrimidine kinase/phosphomethylpyrimidine kinase n=1 Tax=Paenibacillus sp. 32O-W TaxID=1695218 RepID=UPI000720FBA1|nr:bifunctional hydroxymethylpyrimidine kinase/phosphomethylpyrimidine kinase [Paenibacillus sp. 32O-W]ALS29307.1 phosphomethylpyrimidine kinase [Paenibacillus sp. 32O-W]